MFRLLAMRMRLTVCSGIFPWGFLPIFSSFFFFVLILLYYIFYFFCLMLRFSQFVWILHFNGQVEFDRKEKSF